MPAFGIEGDLSQRFDDAAVSFGVTRTRLVYLQTLGDDLADRHTGAEAAEGVLEDHLHLAPQRAHSGSVETLDVAPVKDDVTLAAFEAQQ